MQKQTLIVTNSTGIHARPAVLLVKTANRFGSDISIYTTQNVEAKANAKSITSIFSLGITRGTEITIEVNGSDEIEAIEAIVALLSSLE